ncbi:MAG TPA: dTDP-glucose 4,6-dehydratase [Gemmatales bacterium]|nr:dTDP-glucose 4,6-dehydratase [Gemmatales bacterium]
MLEVMVTGGCGFIGSNFVRHLLAADSQVRITNIDKLTYAGNLANLADLAEHPRLRFVRADIADRTDLVAACPTRLDAIIHFAAESHVDRSLHDASPFIRTNIQGTLELLELARGRGVKRFVQISTDEVYGSLGPQGAFSETTPLAPNSPYAVSKASADLLVRSYVHTYGMDAVITRCSNNYGPYQFPEKLLPLFICNLMADRLVPVYGDGQQVRDWIHVADHCRAIELVWRQGRAGEVYNIGGGAERTNLEMTRLLLKLLGKPESLIQYVAAATPSTAANSLGNWAGAPR